MKKLDNDSGFKTSSNFAPPLQIDHHEDMHQTQREPFQGHNDIARENARRKLPFNTNNIHKHSIKSRLDELSMNNSTRYLNQSMPRFQQNPVSGSQSLLVDIIEKLDSGR